MQHLDEGSLQAWLDRTRSGMEPGDLDSIERHLDACARCAKRVEELETLTRRTGALLSGLPASPSPLPEYRRIGARARELGRTRRRHAAWAAAGWAASVAVALGVGWWSNDLYRARQPAGVDTGVGAAGQSTRAAEAGPTREPVARPVAEAGPIAESDPDHVELAERAELAAPPVVRGHVVDAQAGVPVQAAQVYVADLQVGSLTQPDGSFELSLGRAGGDTAALDLTLTVERIGYRTERRDFSARPGDTISVDFQIREDALQLDEIIVTGVPRGTTRRAIGSAVARLPSGGADPATGIALLDEVEWTPVSRADAEAAIGFALRSAPDLDEPRVEVGTIGEVEAVRIRQSLDSDATLTLIQSREPFALDGDAVPSDRSVASITRDGVYIIAVAPVTSDSLNALLARMR